ncbi:MAG: hypothetical protein AABX75_01775 [Nanoarchaeota archaeon]
MPTQPKPTEQNLREAYAQARKNKRLASSAVWAAFAAMLPLEFVLYNSPYELLSVIPFVLAFGVETYYVNKKSKYFVDTLGKLKAAGLETHL